MRESAKRRTELYSDLVKLDDKSTKRSLTALTKAPAPGKKIQKDISCTIKLDSI